MLGVTPVFSYGGLRARCARIVCFILLTGCFDAASCRLMLAQNTDAVRSRSQRDCGPPAYNCSRTDFKTVQLPESVPNVGNLVGANRTVNDPDFGNPIVRITDWNTDPALPEPVRNFVSAASGSADENLWNTDSTLFLLQSVGTAGYPFTFDPATLQASRLYVSHYPATKGLKLPDGGSWSRVNANLLYFADGATIYTYDFSDRNTPPSPQLFFDFKGHKCLPSGFSVTWQSRGGISAGDTVLGMAYSDAGGQGSGVYAVAYKVGSGCTVLNTQTGEVSGAWGATGTISIPDRWTIHNAKISKDGNWLVVAMQNCISRTCSQGPYFWQIGTTHVSSCGDGSYCGGHWTEGYTHWVNNNNSPIGNQVIRPLAEVRTVQDLTKVLPPNLEAPLDSHSSWNNTNPNDNDPFLVTTVSPTRPFPAPLYNEIIAVASDGKGTIWRFAHNFITARSPYFSTQNGIGSVSQDGRFFIFSSDWMGTLGSQFGTPDCRPAVDCRGDVFVVQLN
jgi:hypothetical protein